ncbi:MAG: hypothetical protein HY921_10885 [Elusimicrobia bacterium]|nr:hypothetical protein [Elusimicrobiota bacterium]
MNKALASAFLAAALGAAAMQAQAQLGGSDVVHYTPPSHAFYCDIPAVGWESFEEEEPSGFAVHLLGPDNPAGTYRLGIDIHWVEKGQPGWVPYKKAVENLRRSAPHRSATASRAMRISGSLAKVFEVSETRRLPADLVPMVEEEIHHFMAVVPSGESYYMIRLSSSQENFMEYRNLFVKFLRSFKMMGEK